MSRIVFRGGPWTNTEDELLKAALSKYGLNNWDQVASLLENRKTPQQCKDRWEEYLDPSVNKGEWKLQEEETLVKIHELFPGEWRRIAQQLPGRRGWQCEEHYRAILESTSEEGQSKDENGRLTYAPDALIAELRNKRMQMGGGSGGLSMTFDSRFETRAARPDAVDADRRVKEMVETAIARLGNQDSKKQSRDMRKQQLSETSFITTLQRAREMEETGTMSRSMQQARAAAVASATRKRPRSDGTGSGSDAEDDGHDDEDDADSFTPIEVTQSAATHRKANRLVANNLRTGKSNNLSDDTDEVASRAAIDVTQLFGSGSSAGVATAAASAAALSNASGIDWGSMYPSAATAGWNTRAAVLPQASMPSERLPSSTQPPARRDVEAPHVAVTPRWTEATVAEVLEPHQSSSNHVSREAYEAAAAMIDDEVVASSSMQAGDGVDQELKNLVHSALFGGASAHPAALTGVVSINEVEGRCLRLSPSLIASTKESRGSYVASWEQESQLLMQASRACHFYRDVCLPAERSEVSRRRAELDSRRRTAEDNEAAAQREYRSVLSVTTAI